MLPEQKTSFFADDPGNSLPTDAATHETAATGPSQRLRESCDFCTKRKRKCDGDSVNRCSFCVAKNRPECHFSVRRLTGPRPNSASRRASKELPGKVVKTTAPSMGGWDVSGGSGGLISQPHCSSVLPLKRARLSPSPATGLIGLRENVYIADFFRTIGFVPITSESFIRKAVVNTMFRAVQEREPGFHWCPAGFGREEEEETEEGGRGDGAVVPRADSGVAIESAAGACVLWCTVAVGCLMGGRPKSSVDGYARLAREALSGCFDAMSVQTARAFTAMALLQDLRGSEEKVSKYINFARSIMSILPPEEVPTDLTDAHMIFKACDMFNGFYDQLCEEDLRDAMEAVSGPAKVPIPIQHAELCRWLLKTELRLLTCFSMDMQNKCYYGDPSKAGTRTPCSGAGPASDSGLGSAPGSDGDGSGDLLPTSPPHVVHGDDAPGIRSEPDTHAPRVCWRPSGTVAEPPPPGPMSQKFAARVLPNVKLMVHVTQSPEVRGGVGEVYFWMLLGYFCLIQGQPNNAMDGFLRCTDILVKNPGMCRFTSWKHLVHVCLACMVVSDNPEKYEKLRISHNSVGALRAPPFEKFRGVGSICGNIFCKSVDKLFLAVVALKREPPNLCGDASASSKLGTERCSPEIDSRDSSDMTSYSSEASDESWARGVFDKHRRPADTEGGHGKTASPPAGAAAAAGVAAASAAAPGASFEFVGAFGGIAGEQQHPRGTGVRFRFGRGAGSAGSMTASSISRMDSSNSSTSSTSSSVGPVSPGDAAAVTAAASTVAGQGRNRCLDQQDQQAGPWFAQVPLLPPVPSAQTSVSGPAGVGGNGNDNWGLELLHAPELLGAEEAAGVLDAVDELLGEGVLERFGEGGSEEDMLPFVEGNA